MPAERVPYKRIAADMRDRIARGDWQPGDPIPSLDKLASEYQVSRATVQRAVGMLVAEGLLETEPRYGTFVAERAD
jgi:GntR family transcriptional regulator